ncbi:MAG: efflux RND transporter permease subunit [Acidobacteriota bacterium]
MSFSLPRLGVANPVLVHLIVILTVIAGIMAYRTMPKDQYPDVAMAAVVVTTVFPGASPKEVEQLVTIPLEEELTQLDDIDTMESTSSEGISVVFLQFDTDVDENFEKVTEVQNKINQVQRFPDDAEPSKVQEVKPPFFTATVAVLGSAPEHEVKEYTDDLENALKNLSGVAEVRVAGLREREIWVEVDPTRLYSYQLSLSDLSDALARRNLNLPGGNIKLQRGEFTVRTEAEFKDLDQIRNTIVKEDDNGYVYLRDVARVTDTFEDRRSLARLDGQPSVTLVINKDRTSNTITLVQEIRDTVDRFEERLPAGMYTRIVDDTSIEVKSRLGGLYSNLLLGLVLVIVAIWVLIGIRPALMVAAGIPVAFLLTFVMIQAYGFSVNTLVLFSLILVIGLVVDDAIVVCENIYRHYETGMPLAQAAIKGTEQIMLPVCATVMTTVAAFLPLLIMEGLLGEFMGIIPVVVTFALLASLAESFFVLPSHVAEWGGKRPPTGLDETRPWFHRTLERYRKMLRTALRLRYLAVALVIVAAFGSLALAVFGMDFVLFGGRDLSSFSVAVEAPPGATVEETTRILSEIEDKALELNERTGEADSIRMEVGGLQRGGMNRSTGTNLGEVTFDLTDINDRDRFGSAIADEVRDLVGEVTGVRALNIEESQEGPPVGKPVQVRIIGDNFDTLREISERIKNYLHDVDGVKDIIDSFPPGKDEVRPALDLEKIAALGLDVRTIATEIRGAFDGLEATRVYDGDEEIEVMVKYDEDSRASLSSLADMQFATPDGMVPFSNVARLERRPGVASITHYFETRTINVTADVITDIITSNDVNQMLMAEFSDLGSEYPGYSLTFGGEFEDTQESVNSMFRAFTVSIILIYVILGGLFRSFVQPLIVMFSVPFAFIGVILGFFILNEPLGLFSIIGTIALAGIVVNDSLIMIDFINRKRREGFGEIDSILEACSIRLRPILLTSITTVLGLLPIAVGLFGVDEFLKPMAIAIGWGLFLSTGLCLILIPCVYRIFDDFSKLIFKKPLGTGHAIEAHLEVADLPKVDGMAAGS